MSTRLVPPAAAIRLVARGVFIEVVRRREFAVLLILMGVFALGAIVSMIVGFENAATASLLLNLGLSLAAIASHVLAGLTAARQIPAEIEGRTLFPMLAKPIERGEYIVGKWLASAACGCIAWTALFLLAWLAVPKPMGAYNFTLLWQLYALMCASLALLAAAGVALSLVVPQGVNIVLMVLVVGAWDKVANFVLARFEGDSQRRIVDWMLHYVPDFGNLNLVTRYTDGIGPLPAGDFLALGACAGLFALAALMAAVWAIERRPL